MRTPKQVLVIPYFIEDSTLKLCILKRAVLDTWQWVAGGVEDNESIHDAAIRESSEELGICCQHYNLLKLETQCSIPKCYFYFQEYDCDDFYTITEHSFAIELKHGSDIKISAEHSECSFITYHQLKYLKTWDSNRIAAWELRQRLLDNNLIIG